MPLCLAESLCLLPVGCGVLCRNDKNGEFKLNFFFKKHLQFLVVPSQRPISFENILIFLSSHFLNN